MKLTSTILAGIALLFLSASAYGDPLVTDSLNLTLTDGGTVTGTITVDAVIGTVTGMNFTVYDDSTTYTFDSIYYQGCNSTECDADSEDANGNVVLIGFETPTMVGFTGHEAVCTGSGNCGGGPPSLVVDNNVVFVADSLATTPEPSSLVLLGTGVLGAAGMLRRRFLQA